MPREIDDPQNPIGTDAVKVMEAIESVADADHVLVMMDMGSALLSAETALGIAGSEIAAKYVCVLRRWSKVHWQQRSARPRERISTKVIFDAMHALEAKREQLGLPSSDTEISDTCPPYDEEARSSVGGHKTVTACMYVRPPGWFIPLSTFNADMLLEKTANALHRREY